MLTTIVFGMGVAGIHVLMYSFTGTLPWSHVTVTGEQFHFCHIDIFQVYLRPTATGARSRPVTMTHSPLKTTIPAFCSQALIQTTQQSTTRTTPTTAGQLP